MKKNTLFIIVLLIILYIWISPKGNTPPMVESTIPYTELSSIKSIPNVHLQDSNNYVSNPDGILTEEAVLRINQYLNELEKETGIEVAVVAVNSIGAKDARSFATELFNRWGIGKKEYNNGLLIQLVTQPPQRSVVFETGYGLEGDLPDIVCYRIQQECMLPDMENGDYSAGMVKGVEAVTNLLAYNVEPRKSIPLSTENKNTDIVFWFVLLLFGIPIVALLVAWIIWHFFPKKCPACKKRTFRFTDSKVIKKPSRKKSGIKEIIYTCNACGYIEKERITFQKSDSNSSGSSGSNWSSGSSSGSSSSSDSGSWGGGSSGGGGAISRF